MRNHDRPEGRWSANFARRILCRNKNEFRARVADLFGDLWAGERDVDRDVHGAGQMQREIGNDPLEAIFGDVGDAVAGCDAGGLEFGG